MSTGIRGSQVFLLADLEQLLQSIALTNELAQRSGCSNQDYTAGFNAALLTVSVGIGLAGARGQRVMMGGRT